MKADTTLEEKFQARYKSLNKAQKKAVDTIDGPVMVIAGPGTGKTTILTLRIANILKQTDTPASGILAITFTDAGVKAMKAKLRDTIGTRADEVKIFTFHSFAGSIISEFPDHFVHLDRTRQMTDIDEEAMLRKLLTNPAYSALRPLGNPDFYIGPIISGIRDAKKEALTPEAVGLFAEEEKKRIESDESSISTRGATKGELKAEAKNRIAKCEKTEIFAKIYATYEAEKRSQKLRDYDDLISELLKALSTDELLLRLLQEKYLYILVDEHQDTNDSQNGIIKLLANFFDRPNVFIVGDEKQAIYRFQGASVKNFLQFKDIWKDISIISLEENYRSHQHILDASFKMIESNYAEGENEDLRIKLLSKNGDKARQLDVVQVANVENGESYLITELKRLVEEDPAASIALIARTNKEVDRLIRLCQEVGIPVAAERSIDIFSHPIGIAFFSLIEFLYDEIKLPSLARTIAVGMWGLSFEKRTEVLKKLKQDETTELPHLLPALLDIRKEFAIDSPISFMINSARLSGFTNLLVTDPAYVEVWRGILGLSESIVAQSEILDARVLIERLLEYKTSAQKKSVKVQIGVPEVPVHIMTAHGSKGLEFDYVFLPYATEESWVHKSRSAYFVFSMDTTVTDEDAIRDSRRLFYVALTRAKKHAVLIIPLEDPSGNPLPPLRFVSELDENTLSYITYEKRAPRELIGTTKSGTEVNKTKLLDYIKRTLTERGLSVTALNNFLDCPSTFIYRSILQMPEERNSKAEKGNAIHKAFDHAWRLNDKSVENLQSIIEVTARDYMKQTFLPTYEKIKVQEELDETIPNIAKSLYPHFNQEGTSYVESWAERFYENETAKILLRGKLDAVVEKPNDVLVFDYKTRGKMSINEIKGDTKNSEGNYFRQLAFYDFLLENDSRFKGKKIIPSLVFVTPDKSGNCHIESFAIEKADADKLQGEINSLIESVWSGKILTEWCDDPKCEYCALKKLS